MRPQCNDSGVNASPFYLGGGCCCSAPIVLSSAPWGLRLAARSSGPRVFEEPFRRLLCVFARQY